jgi:integrase
MKIGGYDMAKKNYHHLFKRGNIWYFRKDGFRISLETTVATEAMRLRDKLLENYHLYGEFQLKADAENQLTFGQVVKEWAKIHSKNVKYSTWRDYRSAMNTHVLPAFKDKPIRDITYSDVSNFVSGLDCGSKRINNILVPMRSVFKMASINDYVDDNVMLKIDNQSVEPPDIYPFTHDQVLMILDAVDPHYKAYTAVRFYTGMRAGEIDGLAWADYKEDMKPEPKLHINKAYVYGMEGKTKTKKSKRYIDCLPPVLEALADQRQLTGKGKHIFLTKDGQRMNPDHYRDVVWRPALEKAGLEYRPPIQTRHTFATMMLSEGEDPGWVQNMMGHSSLQMIYTRYYAWNPKKTRRDGSAFMKAIAVEAEATAEKAETVDRLELGKDAKVIPLFGKNDPITTHPTKKGSQ